MHRDAWLLNVAVHSDAWLLAMAGFYGSSLDVESRKRLFDGIQGLKSCFDVVQTQLAYYSKLAQEQSPHTDTSMPHQHGVIESNALMQVVAQQEIHASASDIVEEHEARRQNRIDSTSYAEKREVQSDLGPRRTVTDAHPSPASKRRYPSKSRPLQKTPSPISVPIQISIPKVAPSPRTSFHAQEHGVAGGQAPIKKADVVLDAQSVGHSQRDDATPSDAMTVSAHSRKSQSTPTKRKRLKTKSVTTWQEEKPGSGNDPIASESAGDGTRRDTHQNAEHDVKSGKGTKDCGMIAMKKNGNFPPSTPGGGKKRGTSASPRKKQPLKNKRRNRLHPNAEEDNDLCNVCSNCGRLYVDGDFWIQCDFCNTWYDGDCVDISLQQREILENCPHETWKCPFCS